MATDLEGRREQKSWEVTEAKWSGFSDLSMFSCSDEVDWDSSRIFLYTWELKQFLSQPYTSVFHA